LSAEVFEQLEDKAEKKDIKLGFGSGTFKNIMVKADQHRIKQVFQNLVLNGINYTEEGGRVTIDFEVKRENVVIHIKDTGKGISPEHLDRIFQRFYRVEKSRGKSHDRGGTGLGLSIVKHILDQHQTKIKVKSTPNKGSDFYFELPKGK
jgi:two-component system phosphate regulon sensor histidine kinase PhoR